MSDDTYEESSVSEVARKYNKDYYTVEDWESWDESFRAELHDGTLIVMEAPVIKHQSVLMDVAAQFHAFLKGKPCRVFPAPFGVRLNDREDTIFEPDIIVVCDKSKLEDGKRCNGAPDLVVEILSPSTSRIDKLYKFDKYLKAGVREYWIIDPDLEILQANVLHGGSYIAMMYGNDRKVKVSVLEGCEIDLAEVFA